jgi:tetratricopeptide (TPR) repeat protein
LKFFDGLHSYEIVMLVLGILLFLAAIVLLVVAFAKGRPYSKLLVFFVVSIIMIGYPSIKSIEFGKDGIKIEKYSAALAQDPTNKVLRNQLSAEVNYIAKRPSSNPKVLTVLAHAQLMLGDEQAAKTNVEKALREDPTFGDAVTLKSRIQTAAELPALTKQVEQKPADTVAKQQLRESVETLTASAPANPLIISNIASAQAALGDKKGALSNVNKALEINPALPQALALQGKLQIKEFEAKPGPQ